MKFILTLRVRIPFDQYAQAIAHRGLGVDLPFKYDGHEWRILDEELVHDEDGPAAIVVLRRVADTIDA